ncbi:hypothetical protein [Pseudomonas sp. UBA4194]|uniref:hypothetical protein n=1 Tax=Pseudomonas sp. UBA4194 TaxID=1947317 RepID=UPI0025F847CC|nr:hypothetical protein [Pseudomonas sp. UBA4194]
MRTLMGITALALLAGCSSAQLEYPEPALAETSTKSPQAYTQCLAPKWQQFDRNGEVTQNGDVWLTTVTAGFTHAFATAQAAPAAEGSKVEVRLPTEWKGTTAWTEMARSCL